jgi:hypothetical protein
LHSPTYLVRRLLRQSRKGVTKASYCTMSAILKFDCEETPHGVYNELVALKLGQRLNAPVAAGVLAATSDGQTFASIEAGGPGMVLPDVSDANIDSIATRYPIGAAALVAFDIWIGNSDRKNNLKAFIASPHIDLFVGFDHGAALLGFEDDPSDQIKRLSSDAVLVNFHPFYQRVSRQGLANWVQRIESITDQEIREACVFGKPFRAVGLTVQVALANALIDRRNRIAGIIQANAQKIGV